MIALLSYLGAKVEVSRLKNIIPYITVWHCSAYRLELTVSDVLKQMGAMNHFKILMDKLYAIHSTSNKKQMAMKESADSFFFFFFTCLNVQLCKIGRIFRF